MTAVFCILTTRADAGTIPLTAGWNLVSSRVAITVSETFSDSSKIVSVWKWKNNLWSIYISGQTITV